MSFQCEICAGFIRVPDVEDWHVCVDCRKRDFLAEIETLRAKLAEAEKARDDAVKALATMAERYGSLLSCATRRGTWRTNDN